MRVSHADEDALLARISGSPAQQVLALATAKALDVARAMRADPAHACGGEGVSGPGATPDSCACAARAHSEAEGRSVADGHGVAGAHGATEGPVALRLAGHAAFRMGARAPELPAEAEIPPLVLGCDSMLEIDGEVWGKPHTPEAARGRLRRMSGSSGVLHTGHCLASAANGLFLSAVSHARVHIARMSEAEIDAYIATGEPLEVAGSFTVDGLGGPFVEKVDGDYHGVVGLSLPLLREMMAAQGLSVTQLWSGRVPACGELPARARHFLASPRPFSPGRDSDGFVLCGCGSRHWGLAGAAGVAAWRERGGVREVLLQLRSAWSHGGATWSIPGGAREWEESSWACAAREFAEETGIPASCLDAGAEPRPVFVASHPDWRYETYVARCDGDGASTPNRESEELRWVRLDAPLPGPLHPEFAQAWPELREAIDRA